MNGEKIPDQTQESAFRNMRKNSRKKAERIYWAVKSLLQMANYDLLDFTVRDHNGETNHFGRRGDRWK